MIVEAVDGLYYVQPIVFGQKCYLTFENGFPEAVVQSKSFAYGRRLARTFGHVVEHLDQMKRAFPPDFQGLKMSVSYRVEIKKPIPVPSMHKGWTETLSPGALTWNAEFTQEEVVSIFSDEPSQKLLQWILGIPVTTGLAILDPVLVEEARQKINSQIPTMPGKKKVRLSR